MIAGNLFLKLGAGLVHRSVPSTTFSVPEGIICNRWASQWGWWERGMTGAWYEGLSTQWRFESGSVSFHWAECIPFHCFSDTSRDRKCTTWTWFSSSRVMWELHTYSPLTPSGLLHVFLDFGIKVSAKCTWCKPINAFCGLRVSNGAKPPNVSLTSRHTLQSLCRVKPHALWQCSFP